MICLYHSKDLDGKCSGAIIKDRYPECEIMGIDYGDRMPEIKKDEHVCMVDFSLQPWELMQELADTCHLVWIDHRVTAIGDYKAHGLDAAVYAEVGKAACEQTWDYLHPCLQVPDIVRALGRYDVWDHADPNTMPIQYGMRMRDTDPSDPIWQRVFSNDVALKLDLIRQGNTIITYQERHNAEYVRQCAFETQLMGHRCIAANAMLSNSQLFDSIWDPDKHDVMIAFGWREGEWHVGVYTTKDDVDVSGIAKYFGGGGHAQAAGFRCPELPFNIGNGPVMYWCEE